MESLNAPPHSRPVGFENEGAPSSRRMAVLRPSRISSGTTARATETAVPEAALVWTNTCRALRLLYRLFRQDDPAFLAPRGVMRTRTACPWVIPRAPLAAYASRRDFADQG